MSLFDNQIDLEEPLKDSIIHAMENYGFIDAVPIEKRSLSKDGRHMVVSNPDLKIKIILVFPFDIINNLAGNIFDEEVDKVPGDIIDDCILEFGNIFSGNLWDKLTGEKGKIKIPFPFFVDDPGQVQINTDNLYCFDCEGSILGVAQVPF